ncbi:MAG TPA: tetratricopeptide repeat protein [Thermoanaerobaculia bacterium]|nr:tetratricopeptide repeat protein [Thermoanaerobaculia bacterium]
MHRSAVVLMMVLLALPTLTGCNKVKARADLKQGNEYYAKEQYRAALKQFQQGLERDPGATFAWRSVGLTALALYRPGDAGAENAQFANTATSAFEKYLADYPEDDKIREYLLTTYVNAKQYDKALVYLDQQARANPADPQVQSYKVKILIQAGRLDEAMRLAQRQTGPGKADSLAAIGMESWNKAYNDPALNAEARGQVVENGLTAIKSALDAKPEFFEAMVYYGLLLREKAKLETDAIKRQEYIDTAIEWQKKAQELRKKDMARQAEEAKQKAKTES